VTLGGPPSALEPAAQVDTALLVHAAQDAAAAAGSRVRRELRERRADLYAPAEHRALEHDVKLALDVDCEREVLRVVRGRFPRHAVLSEEAGFQPGSEPFVWIVDPLDGTVNFHHGIPFFCSSVACYGTRSLAGDDGSHVLPDGRILGAPLAGAVYDPLREEMFLGAAGREASLNGARLRPPVARCLDEVVVAVSMGAREESVSMLSRALPILIETARKVRSFGSTALDLVQVAAGRVGAFIQVGTNLWDIAAAALIVQGAGARVELREYAPGRFRVIAAAAGIFSEVERIVEGTSA